LHDEAQNAITSTALFDPYEKAGKPLTSTKPVDVNGTTAGTTTHPYLIFQALTAIQQQRTAIQLLPANKPTRGTSVPGHLP
jgi:hypothetical protein